MKWLLARETMIAFALLGGIASVLAMLLERREGSRDTRTRHLNRLSYAFMAISIALFIIAGLRGPRA